MDHLSNIFKNYAAGLDQLQASPRLATVTSVDPATACARVTHQPEGVLSGWLPVLSLWTGKGWGVVCLPGPGDQVLVLPHDADPASGIIVGSIFSDATRCPTNKIGELVLVHQSGTSLRLANDGTVRIAGDLHVEGDVYDRQGALSRLRTAHNTHIHTDAVGRPTSTPTAKD